MNRNRQIVTRFQELRIAETFPFLDLPAELRTIIYEYCYSFAGVDKWFDTFWEILKASRKVSKARVPHVYRQTPTVLLICKQIYFEAIASLGKQSLSFHHGMLDLNGLQHFVKPSVIQNIGHITLDCQGHEILPKTNKDKLQAPSWRGHLDLIADISRILAKGHKLKSFTLNLEDKTIHHHVTACIFKDIRCDFRDQLIDALQSLKSIRGVPVVNLSGIPHTLLPELKARMQSTPKNFMDLPGELRNQIYAHCADWSDISAHIARTASTWRNKSLDPCYPARSTPSILLLNKKIHAEASPILRAKPLNLVLPAEYAVKNSNHTLNALKFITPATLARVQHLVLRIEAWEWIYALDRFIINLGKNHSLKTLRIIFHDKFRKTFLAQGKAYPDHQLHQSLSHLGKVRGVGLVEFQGDLPDVYTAPLRMVMESGRVEGEVLPVLGVERAVGGFARDGGYVGR